MSMNMAMLVPHFHNLLWLPALLQGHELPLEHAE
jgi:hypothetical protein